MSQKHNLTSLPSGTGRRTSGFSVVIRRSLGVVEFPLSFEAVRMEKKGGRGEKMQTSDLGVQNTAASRKTFYPEEGW